jgi:putative SOS response-associated peptidase YedK
MEDGGPMPLAGLWETYCDRNGSEIDTAAIVTTDSNGTVSAVHDRMPVILSRDAIGAWLDTDAVSADEAMRLVRPCPDAWLTMFPVSTRVNKVDNDDPDLQRPLAAPEAKPVGQSRKAAKPRSSDEDEQGRLF